MGLSPFCQALPPLCKTRPLVLTAEELIGIGRQPTRGPALLRNIFLPSPSPLPPIRPFNGCRGQGGKHALGKCWGPGLSQLP